MKKFLSDFFHRGLTAAAGGPVVLAVIYWILGLNGTVTALTPGEVSRGILTITLLALVVGGMSAIYQVERLPLLSAILIHGGVLYITYIVTYLLNGWLRRQWIPVAVFTVIFVAAYALIWLLIYHFTKAGTDRINAKLSKDH